MYTCMYIYILVCSIPLYTGLLDPTKTGLQIRGCLNCVHIHDICVIYVICISSYVYSHACIYKYGVATISRLLQIIGLFCRMLSLI